MKLVIKVEYLEQVYLCAFFHSCCTCWLPPDSINHLKTSIYNKLPREVSHSSFRLLCNSNFGDFGALFEKIIERNSASLRLRQKWNLMTYLCELSFQDSKFPICVKKLNLGTLKTNIDIFDIFGTLRKISIRTIKNQRKYDNNVE